MVAAFGRAFDLAKLDADHIPLPNEDGAPQPAN
jgi:hypothetical protein